MDTGHELFVICSIRDVPNRRGLGLVLATRGPDGGEQPLPVVLVRWDRDIFAYRDACPHHGNRLDWGGEGFIDSNGLYLMCGKHGALFDPTTGCCIEGPCRGNALTPLNVTVRGGDVCIGGMDLIEDDDEG